MLSKDNLEVSMNLLKVCTGSQQKKNKTRRIPMRREVHNRVHTSYASVTNHKRIRNLG